MKALRALLVEDSADDAELVCVELEAAGYDVSSQRVETATGLQAALGERTWDVIISDYSMPSFDGLRALRIVRDTGIDVPFLIVSGTIGEEVAVEAMKAGVDDYLVKGNLRRLAPAVAREIRVAHERTQAELDQQRLEEQVRVAQRMEAVGRLAAGVAHDFNNVLTVIQTYVGFVREQFRDGDPARDDLDAVLDAANRAARLTNQLLAFSRRQTQELAIVDLTETVCDIHNLLRRLIGEDIDLVTVLDEDVGLVRIDRSQIEQVLMNLAVNARDAMPTGGKLTIETTNVVLDESYGDRRGATVPAGNYVMVAVTDTGEGMDAETQSHAFEPFFTTKGSRGTGLGLSTVYGVLKQSHGYVWIYSEPEDGTTFKIYLPRVDADKPSQRHRARPVVDMRGSETVLVVEDEEMLRNAATRILSKSGYNVLAAAHGGDALLTCERYEGEIHLMITDVVMPQMSGSELAQRLAVTRPDMKVIYMSGYTENAIAHRGVLDEGVVFVQKPFLQDRLLQKIRETLDAVGT